MTRDELRRAIRYHRQFHRPQLFAETAKSIQDCGMPSCRAVMAELGEEARQRVRAPSVSVDPVEHRGLPLPDPADPAA